MLHSLSLSSCFLVYTLNRSYNLPPYILAASSNNKSKASTNFSFIQRVKHCQNSLSNFISKGVDAVRIKVSSIQKVTFLAKDYMNPKNGICGNKFIHEMLPTALICQSKAAKVLMQSNMPLGLRRRALLSVQSRQMSFKHTTIQHQSTKFAPVCILLNYRLHGIEVFNDIWSSVTF